jgi:hypothetical protein
MGAYGYSSATNGTPSAGTASGTILAANPHRVYALFINNTDTLVWLSLGTAAAVAGNGIPLPGTTVTGVPGTYEMTRGKANVFSGQITGIVGSGTVAKTIAVVEG